MQVYKLVPHDNIASNDDDDDDDAIDVIDIDAAVTVSFMSWSRCFNTPV